jgi:tRNA dimethylallyltransferase
MTTGNKPKIIIVVGPTASGKSDLAIRLAKKYGGETISADSRQVYRGMDIGTGKVLKDKTLPVVLKFKNKRSKLGKNEYYSEGIKHYLIDVANPKRIFTADDFRKLGQKSLSNIVNRYKLPIICGGTGFYIDSLLSINLPAPVPPDPKLRAKLEKWAPEELFTKLLEIDPRRAKTIDRHNKRRLIRAIEIVLTTGKPVPAHTSQATDYNTLWLGINFPKEILAKRIEKRLNTRISMGMFGEVWKLHKEGLSWKRMYDLGLEYRYASIYLRRQFPISNSKFPIIEKNFRNSEEYNKLLSEIIKYSKRQMTWFKRNKEIIWIEDNREAEKLVKDFLNKKVFTTAQPANGISKVSEDSSL